MQTRFWSRHESSSPSWVDFLLWHLPGRRPCPHCSGSLWPLPLFSASSICAYWESHLSPTFQRKLGATIWEPPLSPDTKLAIPSLSISHSSHSRKAISCPGSENHTSVSWSHLCPQPPVSLFPSPDSSLSGPASSRCVSFPISSPQRQAPLKISICYLIS